MKICSIPACSEPWLAFWAQCVDKHQGNDRYVGNVIYRSEKNRVNDHKLSKNIEETCDLLSLLGEIRGPNILYHFIVRYWFNIVLSIISYHTVALLPAHEHKIEMEALQTSWLNYRGVKGGRTAKQANQAAQSLTGVFSEEQMNQWFTQRKQTRATVWKKISQYYFHFCGCSYKDIYHCAGTFPSVASDS